MKPPIFVCGTPRSGTTIFFKMMAEHPELSWFSTIAARYPTKKFLNKVYLHCLSVPLIGRKLRQEIQPAEAYPYWETLFPGFRRPCRDLKAADVTIKTKNIVINGLESATCGGRRDRFIAKITGWPRIGFLQEVFPFAKFIHIIRDGRAVANSLLTTNNFWGGWQGPHNWRLGPLAPDLATIWGRSHHSFTVLAALEWVILENAFREAISRAEKGSVISIKYEDFCDNPIVTLKSVFEFCDLGFTPSLSKHLASYRIRNANSKWREDLSDLQREELETVLAPYLKSYGYTDR